MTPAPAVCGTCSARTTDRHTLVGRFVETKHVKTFLRCLNSNGCVAGIGIAIAIAIAAHGTWHIVLDNAGDPSHDEPSHDEPSHDEPSHDEPQAAIQQGLA